MRYAFSAQCRFRSVGADAGGGRSPQTDGAERTDCASAGDVGSGTQSLVNSSACDVMGLDCKTETTGLQ